MINSEPLGTAPRKSAGPVPFASACAPLGIALRHRSSRATVPRARRALSATATLSGRQVGIALIAEFICSAATTVLRPLGPEGVAFICLG
jgi:hypothetical protein